MFDLVFLDPPFKDEKIMFILNSLVESKIINSETLIIIHRNKKKMMNLIKSLKSLEKKHMVHQK